MWSQSAADSSPRPSPMDSAPLDGGGDPEAQPKILTCRQSIHFHTKTHSHRRTQRNQLGQGRNSNSALLWQEAVNGNIRSCFFFFFLTITSGEIFSKVLPFLSPLAKPSWLLIFKFSCRGVVLSFVLSKIEACQLLSIGKHSEGGCINHTQVNVGSTRAIINFSATWPQWIPTTSTWGRLMW